MAHIRRKHGRIRDELPPEIREQVDRLLIEGAAYEEVREFLTRRGIEIGRSSIGRYGKDFLNAYSRLRVVEDKSRALVSETGDGLVLEEAASKIFAQMVIEAQLSGDLDIKALPRIISDFAKLQSSSIMRERIKLTFEERAKSVAEEVVKVARTGGLTEEKAALIKKKILGIV